MKNFIKFTFASMLGIILAGIVFTIIGIVTMVGIFTSADTETTVKENTVFVLNMDGILCERAQENNPISTLLGEEFSEQSLEDILSAIKKAKDNENIKGIYIEAGMMEASCASLEEIRNALKSFKESGKFIVAYGDNYTQGMYYWPV